MPKASDPLCPLGFHPQTRWPNRCKRCFRDYNDHKSVKEQSGSTTSLNSLSSYDPNTNSKSWNKSRPVSWSAQDLRAAVDEAKEQIRSSREDLHRLYGSSRSLSQDLGSLKDLRSSSNDMSSSKDDKDALNNYPSFSSYLATRTKSPARPPLTKSSSLHGTSSTSSSARREEEEEKTNYKEEDEPKSTKNSSEPKSWKPSALLSVSDSKPSSSSVSPTSERRVLKSSSLSSISEGKPPKPPSRLKPTIKLGDFKDTPTEDKPKKNILSLREVKSEDESVDATYVISLAKPKKEPKRVEIDLQPEVDRLQKELKEKVKQIEEMSERTETLERENKELLAKKPKFGDLRKQAELSKMQQKVDDMTEDMKSKNKEIKDLKKEIDKRPLPKDVEKTMEDLRSKLQAAEQLCEELMDENEDYKKEIRALEEEIEEMQDNFREEQADEYRDLKRELEQTAKNCRVLQFKLKKAERRSDVLERDKGEIEEKLKELQVGEGDVERAEKIKVLEKEVNLAKEVSMKMHEEMEKMKSQLESAEQDKKKLSEKVLEKPVRPGGKYSRSQMMGREGSQDNTDQLMRDLHDAAEREQDLKDQLKFAEEETKNLRKKVSRVEEENETLALQLKKMSNKAKASRQRSFERSGSQERSNSVERGSLSRQGSTEKPPKEPDEGITEDLDPTELKIQLELNEQEAAVLRRKVEDLETENERLQKEIKGVLASTEKSVKGETGMDAKKLEKEADILRTKIQAMEDENERLCDENKKLQLRVVKRLPLSANESSYIERQVMEEKVRRLERKVKEANEKVKTMQVNSALTASSSENDGKALAANSSQVVNLEETDRLPGEVTQKDNEISSLKKKVDDLQGKYNKLFKDCEEMKISSGYKERTPRVPKDFTPKATLIKWVNELEAECARLHVSLKEAEKKKKPRPTSEDQTNLRDLEDKLEREKERNEELSRQLKEEREKLDKSLTNKRRPASHEDDLRRYEERIAALKKELSQEKERNDELKTKIGDGSLVGCEELRTTQTEKHKLQKELSSAQQTVTVLEKKLKETEETLRLSEKTEKKNKYTMERLETKLDEERNNLTVAEERQKELTVSWLKERDDLKKELTDHKKAREKAERDLRNTKRARDNLETKLEEEKKRAEDAAASKKSDSDELKTLRSQKEELTIECEELKDTVGQLQKVKDTSATRQKRELESLRREKEDLTLRMNTLESELKTEQKRRERLEKETVNVKSSVKAEAELRKVKEELDTLHQQHKDLEKVRSEERKEWEELQSKYELLEEDFVVQKAQLTMNNEGLQQHYDKLQQEHQTIETELKTLRETYNVRQDTWIKEKLTMQEQLRELDTRLKKVSQDPTSYSEKKRLKDIIEDKNQEIERLRREEDAIKDQVSYYRRESEDLRRKVEDLEKLQHLNEKRTSSLTNDTTAFDNTIRELKAKLSSSEKTHKTDLTKIKMKYDSKLKAMTEEVSALTQHMTKYRRERDTYKEMLDGTQRTLAELKGSTTPYRTSRADSASEAQQHLLETQEMQAQMTEFEDKLADARLENTKLKNEVIDQKTNFEIQLCDLQTKLNEYEEDRLLGGGSRRVPGLRTRLELNWQKEREEQQRLIQETATLAKDLRQTLYEVERERDLEKLEAKRKIEQLKKTVGQETSDTKTKVQELQRDLQELREAHAKLRQINEKLRREKDRTEVEREAMRDKYLGSSREHLNQQVKMERLLDEMRKVKDLAPLVLGEGINGRDGSLTRLPGDAKPKTKEEFTESLKKACRTMEDLKRMLSLSDDRDRLKRTASFRRALSDMESEDEGHPLRPRVHHRPGTKAQRSAMHRKTQSLDHQMTDDRNKIWVSTDAGSTTSIDSTLTDDLRRAKYDRDASLDRISTGSQTSDLDVLSDKKKKKGVKDMLSKLTKSRSIEESSTGGSILGAGVKAMGVGVGGSGSDIPTDVEKESKVKGKIKGFFKMGPPSRSQSMDRGTERVGPSVRAVATSLEADTGSMASVSSLESNASTNLPPVHRRYRGRSHSDATTKAQSFSTIGRQRSLETDV